MLHRLVAGVVIVGVLVLGGAAQAPSPSTFDVVSIKRSEPLTPGLVRPSDNVGSGMLFSMSDVTVARLVQYAWAIRDFQVVDGPKWMWNDRFEVRARVGDPTSSPAHVRLMVRSMLEEQFGLGVHWEQRELPYYALVLARPDGRLGPYLQRRADCTNPPTLVMTLPRLPAFVRGGISLGCGPLSEVAGESVGGMPIIDATGLDGRFEYFWFLAYEEPSNLADAPNVLPRVSGALEEYLGLTLRATRGPLDVLVVDSVQQPSEN